MESIDVLINTICNPQSSNSVRQQAEQTLIQLFSNRQSYPSYLSLCYNASDNVVFFVCLGLQRLLWRQWQHLSGDEINTISHTMLSTLTQRSNLQAFAINKIEQVIAVVCIQTVSLGPVVSLLQDTQSILNNPVRAKQGLSLVYTVFDSILSEDMKIDKKLAKQLQEVAQTIVSPLTNLSCSVCSTIITILHALRSNQAASTNPLSSLELNNLLVGLKVLKIVISKLPLGSHVSMDVLNLIYTIVEMGGSRVSTSPNSITGSVAEGTASSREIDQVLEQGGLMCIEILMEVMTKRYIPVDPSVKEMGANQVIVQLAMKTIHLLKMLREQGQMESHPITIPLLDLVGMYVDAHFERCMSSAFEHNHAPAYAQVTSFMQELMTLMCSTHHLELLDKCVSVFNAIMSMEHIPHLLHAHSQTQTYTHLVGHILSVCMCSNKHLDVDSIVEEGGVGNVNVYVDPHIQEVVGMVQSNRSAEGDAIGEGDVYVGANLRISSYEMFSAVCTHIPDIRIHIQQHVTSCLTAYIQSLHTHFHNLAVLLDVSYLIHLTPLMIESGYISQLDLIIQICSVCVQIMERYVQYAQTSSSSSSSSLSDLAKVCVYVCVQCNQVVGQMLQTHTIHIQNLHAQSQTHTPTDSQTPTLVSVYTYIDRFMQQLAQGLGVCMDGTARSGDFHIHTLTTSWCVLYLQSIALYVDILPQPIKETTYKTIGTYIQTYTSPLNPPGQAHTVTSPLMHIEVYVLLVCVWDYLVNQQVSVKLCEDFIHSITLLDQNLLVDRAAGVGGAGNRMVKEGAGTELLAAVPVIEHLCLVAGAMDSLTRNYAVSKGARRNNLTQAFAPLQTNLARCCTIIFQLALYTFSHTHSHSQHSTPVSSPTIRHKSIPSLVSVEGLETSLCQLTRTLLSLTSSLLTSLGRKHFGRMASDVLEASVGFFTLSLLIPQTSPVPYIFTTPYTLSIIQQLVEFIRLLSESTASSSPSVGAQIKGTGEVLGGIMRYLGNERVAGELISPMLHTTLVSIKCYWQSPRSLPFLNSISPPANTQSAIAPTVTPLVSIYTQLVGGCLGGAGVGAGEGLAGVEGLLSLSETYNMFALDWFDRELWTPLLMCTLRALLLRRLSPQQEKLEQLLVALTSAKLKTLKEARSRNTSADNSSNNITGNLIASTSSDGTSCNSGAVEQDIKELYYYIAREAVDVVQSNIPQGGGDQLHAYLLSPITSHPTLASLSPSVVVVDMVVQPLLVYIARCID